VKGVRFPDPRCLPSLEAKHNPRAPKCERTCDALIDRCGAHVMRIAELRPTDSSSPRRKPLRFRAPFFPVAEPLFTRSVEERGFRPLPTGDALL